MLTQPTTVVRSRLSTILLTMLLSVLGLVVACGTASNPSGTTGGTPGGATSGNAPGGGVATPTPTSDTIVIKNFAYVPPSLTVAPGTKITVINEDKAPHTVTAKDNSFDSGTIHGGQRGEVTAPTTPGTYPYICTVHPYMKGTLIVQ
jgi:plastocyanin